MSRSSRLTLVLPRLLNDASGLPTRNSLLARIAGRGEVACRWQASSAQLAQLNPWQRGLLAACDLDERSHPSATLHAMGMGIDMAGTHWLHAEPIHLAAGLNEVRLVPLRGELALTKVEVAAITPTLCDFMIGDGLKVLETPSCEWLVAATEDWDLTTVTTDYARRHEWKDVLPQGAGAGRARRLMTELQMVLHDHPVNEARGARGVPSVNGVWLWGGGTVTPKATSNEVACFGDNAYLRGLCRMHSWAPPAVPHSTNELMSKGGARGVSVIEVSDLDSFESQWLDPLVAEVKRGRIERLNLVIDEWQLSAGSWDLRRFWRQSRTLGSWTRA